MARGKIRSSLCTSANSTYDMDDTPAGLPLPTPSFPPSWPGSWHAFWLPVVLISGDQSVCVLWIKCIVVFIPTSYPTLFSSAEQECMFSLSLFLCVSLPFPCFDHHSLSVPSPRLLLLKLEHEVRRPSSKHFILAGPHQSRRVWRMTQLRSWHRLAYHLATR